MELYIDDNIKLNVETTNPKDLVLLDFYATWCNPCKVMSIVLDEIAKEYSDKVVIEKYDVEKNETLSEVLQIRSVPTIFIYKYGEQVYRHNGSMSKDELDKTIKNLLENK